MRKTTKVFMLVLTGLFVIALIYYYISGELISRRYNESERYGNIFTREFITSHISIKNDILLDLQLFLEQNNPENIKIKDVLCSYNGQAFGAVDRYKICFDKEVSSDFMKQLDVRINKKLLYIQVNRYDNVDKDVNCIFMYETDSIDKNTMQIILKSFFFPDLPERILKRLNLPVDEYEKRKERK